MVKSIVIRHDETRPPWLQDMPDVGAVQEAVDGWLEIIEVPDMGARSTSTRQPTVTSPRSTRGQWPCAGSTRSIR